MKMKRMTRITEDDAQWIIDHMREDPIFTKRDFAKIINVAVDLQDEIAPPETDERLTSEEMREKCLSIYSK